MDSCSELSSPSAADVGALGMVPVPSTVWSNARQLGAWYSCASPSLLSHEEDSRAVAVTELLLLQNPADDNRKIGTNTNLRDLLKVLMALVLQGLLEDPIS